MSGQWMLPLLLAALAFAASLVGTGALRRYAIRKSLFDRPNERSSHAMPTPRGGGVAIVLSFLAALALLGLVGAVPASVAMGIGGGGTLIALIGFWDDHGHVAARWRLLAHAAAAVWLLAWLGGVTHLLGLGAGPLVTGIAFVGAAVGIMWLVNLYNFMDGIDGIASIEAITACVGGIAAAFVVGADEEAVLPLILIGSVTGFLTWNWPPARIFMGDAGSGFIGLAFAGLALAGAHANANLFYAWVILLGLFVVDATVTVLHRAVRGQRLYEAHRSHAYQRASRHYGRHLPVTGATALVNLLWLTPLALVAALNLVPGLAAVAIAYFPLIALGLYWKAGAEDTPAKRN